MNSQSGARTAVIAIAVILVSFLGGLGLSQFNATGASGASSVPVSASSMPQETSASVSLAQEKAATEAAQKKAKAEAEAKAKAEDEAKKKAEEEAKAKAEAEAKAKAEAEAAAKAEAEAKAKAEAEAEAARIQAEAEQKAAEEEAARIAAEEEAARIAAEEEAAAQQEQERAQAASASLNLASDFRASFDHGYKGAEYQKYIVLHDTEGEGDAYSVINYWDGNGAGVAAHFVVNKDGSVVQCVPLDRITHHAGFGDTGHNAAYGVEDESRDDKVGTVPIGDWAADYGMNSYSVGIEMVHTSGSGYYPEEQLAAVDAVIAYIDSYFGFPSTIIDHKAWRSGNSDTSPEFAGYLANYQDHRTHY